MTESLKIRSAIPVEASFLSELALRSKAHWGYSDDFLEACRAELTVAPDRLADGDYPCCVAVLGNDIAGVYSLGALSEGIYELEALFVDPPHIGTGVGGALLWHALNWLSSQSAKRLVIQSDPQAGDFYLAAGARKTGEEESGSIPGRFLPIFEIDIRQMGS